MIEKSYTLSRIQGTVCIPGSNDALFYLAIMKSVIPSLVTHLTRFPLLGLRSFSSIQVPISLAICSNLVQRSNSSSDGFIASLLLSVSSVDGRIPIAVSLFKHGYLFRRSISSILFDFLSAFPVAEPNR